VYTETDPDDSQASGVSSQEEEEKGANGSGVCSKTTGEGVVGGIIVYLHKLADDVKGSEHLYLYVGLILKSRTENGVLYHHTEDRLCSQSTHTGNCLRFLWRKPAKVSKKRNRTGAVKEDHDANRQWVDTRPPDDDGDHEKGGPSNENGDGEKGDDPSKSLVLCYSGVNAITRTGSLTKGVQKAANEAITRSLHNYAHRFRQQTKTLPWCEQPKKGHRRKKGDQK
jgi:hypothetical protein